MSDTEMRELGGTNIAMVFQGLMNALNPVFSVGAQITDERLFTSALHPTLLVNHFDIIDGGARPN